MNRPQSVVAVIDSPIKRAFILRRAQGALFMFIPTWLLVLLAVIVLSMWWPQIWEQLKTLALVAFVFLLLASIPAVFWFGAIKHDPQAAWLVSIPLIIAGTWGAISAGLADFRTSLPIHNFRVRRASDPRRVQELRRSYARAIDLPGKLWEFRNAIKYFPSWYTKTDSDGNPWTSNVIPRAAIANVMSRTDPQLPLFDFSAVGDPPFLVYRFSVGGKEYAFCSRDHVTLYGDTHDADGEPLSGCGVWVIEAPDRVVMALRLAYYSGQYADTVSRERSYVEALKPDAWLPKLLDIAKRVKEDESQKHEQWRKKWERQQADKNFV